MSPKIQTNVDGADEDSKQLPIKPIPGTYGTPFISPILDRLNYYYFQGHEKFFQSRIDKYGSTVFRVNMPPGPFIASDPRVICVLDARSFPVLFDNSKVEKKNVFTGTYMASTSLTGGYRVCSYLDPTEPAHAIIKNLLFALISSRKSNYLPSFRSVYSALFDQVESQLDSAKSSNFNQLNDKFGFEFVGDAFFGVKPSDSPSLGPSGSTKAVKWLLLQIHPLVSPHVLPIFLEELLLHTFRLPPILVRSDYKALYAYVREAAGPFVDKHFVQLLGLSKEEALHNLLFAAFFNTYAGIKVFFPAILARLAQAGTGLHARLAGEIRAAVRDEGGKLTLSAVDKMELTKSVVYESLRIDPPVQLQWGHARKDLVVESHDAAFEVKKGEMLFGYQQFATRDEKVFEKGGEFVADRFVGEKGKELLKYVWWSNGPETESPTVRDKQCAGKEAVPLFGRLLLAEFFLRYDNFAADVAADVIGTRVTVTSLTKASTATD